MKNLKSIAKQWKTITFNQFKAIYNNLKIVDPQDVAKLSGIKLTADEILIMATRKPENPNDKMPTWFKKWNKEVFENVIKHITITIQDLMKEIKSIKSDIVIIKAKLNNHEQLFKQHGWMK